MEWVEKELEWNPKPLAVAEDGGGAPALAVPEGQDQVAVLDWTIWRLRRRGAERP